MDRWRRTSYELWPPDLNSYDARTPVKGFDHVLVPDDALSLRAWVQRGLDQQSAWNQMSRPTTEVDVRELVRRNLRAFGPATGG